MSLAFGQRFSKVLFVHQEFCDYESGTLNFCRRLFSTAAFKTLDISQGSVATHLRYGGIFSDSIITNFSWFWQWNNLENRLISGKVKVYIKIVPNFWATLYIAFKGLLPNGDVFTCDLCMQWMMGDLSSADSGSPAMTSRNSSSSLSNLRISSARSVLDQPEVVFVDPPDPSHMCPVCDRVMRYPVKLGDCGHRCCSGCLVGLVRSVEFHNNNGDDNIVNK